MKGGFYFHPCDEDLSQGTPEMKKPRDGRASGHTRSDSAVWGALLAYMLLRSALLLTVAAPEARYTLECFPMLFAAGGIALCAMAQRLHLPGSKLKALPGNG